MKERNTRDFLLNGLTFHIGDYRRHRNEFERGLKYILIKVYDRTFNGRSEDHYSYHDTGYRGETLRACKEWAQKNTARWI